MRKSMLVKAILILVMSGGHAMAQGSGRSRGQTQGSGSSRAAPPSSSQSNQSNSAVPGTARPRTIAEFAASFWNYLNNPKASYRQWGTPGKTRRQGGQSGLGGVGSQAGMFHREVGQTYLNDTANRNLQRLPLSSVLVREEYAADGQTLENVTVMYRAKGADPEAGNWYWMMYQPDGSLAKTSPEQGGREIAGRVQSCIECHRQAGGNDYLFLNDRPASAAPRANPPRANPSGSGARR